MPGKMETPISVEEYLEDALRHIESVTGDVRKTLESLKTLKPPEKPRLRIKGGVDDRGQIFGRGCEVETKGLPKPWGRGCEPLRLTGTRRRSSGSRKRSSR